MAVTIRDVAEAAGVSIATVSRALHGMTVISARTREHVINVADQLGYEVAFRPVTPRNAQRIAIVLPFIGRWYFAKIMEGIERITREHGIETVLLRMADSSGDAMSIAEYLSTFNVQGCIMVSLPPSESDMRMLHLQNIPTVLIDMYDNRFASVGIDDLTVGRIATNHLISLGHRRIAIVTGDPHEPKNYSTPNDRRAGYIEALNAHGIEIHPDYEIHADFTARAAADAVQKLFLLPEMPTAIFAASDEMAFGIIGAAKRVGLRIPEDLSIIGVDDHDISESVGLTTVAQPIDTMAELAAWQLVSRMTSSVQVTAQRVQMPVSLIERETCARFDPTGTDAV